MKWGNEGGRGYGTSGSVGRGKAKRKTPKSGTARGLSKAAEAYNAAAKKRREAIVGKAKSVGIGLSPHARPLPAVVAERPERGESAVWPRAAKRRRKAARKVSAPSGSRKVISVSGTQRDAANPTGPAPLKSRVDGRSRKGRRARSIGTYGARKPGGQFAGPGWWREQP